jgi:mycofactocin system glycosyltransferase
MSSDETSVPVPADLPSGWRITPADDLRQRGAGRILIGGTPLRIVRLSEGGARIVRHWFGGAAIGLGKNEQLLARRLLANGMAHPTFEHAPSPDPNDNGDSPDDEFTVVIPVKDDQAGLSRTLAGLDAVRVLVVDDGSAIPMSVPPGANSETGRQRVQVLRRDRSGGPGAARNTGLAKVITPNVAFVDAGVEVTTSDLRRLGLHLGDPAVAAVAPRVACSPGSDIISRYEKDRSPLDLGRAPAVVGPGRPISYVPTACLLARTNPIVELGGFDPALRFGEDVDLIWNLAGDAVVRFDPTVVVTHPARTSLKRFIQQRIGYGSAAAPLHDRHRGDVAPVQASGWSYGVAGLLFAGHPLGAAAIAVGTAIALVPKLGELPDSKVEAALLTARAHSWTLRSLCRSTLRPWWPLSLLSLVTGVGRRSSALLLAGGLAQRLLDRPAEPVTDLIIGALDDISYGAGVWQGVFATRQAGPLLPRVVQWPPKVRTR